MLRHILFLPSGNSDQVWALAVPTDPSTKYADDCKVYSPWECPFNLTGYAPSGVIGLVLPSCPEPPLFSP